MENIQRRFDRWLKAKNKEDIQLTLQEKLELLAYGIAPYDLTQ